MQLKTEAKKLGIKTPEADKYYTAYFDVKKVVEDLTKYRVAVQQAQKALVADPQKIAQLTQAVTAFSGALRIANALRDKFPELCG